MAKKNKMPMKKMPVKKMMHSENEMGGEKHMMTPKEMNNMMGKGKPKKKKSGK